MKNNSINSMGYELCRYFTPTSLSASKTLKVTATARRVAMKTQKLTYSMLITAQQKLVATAGLPSQTSANRTTALRHFLEANHLQEEDVIGLEMRPHFPLSVEKMVEKLRQEGKSDRAISNTKSALMSWKQAIVRYDTEMAYLSDSPTPFLSLLKATIGEHPITTVAKQAGVPKDMLFGWLRGKSPRASNVNYVRRVEAFFGIERDSLVGIAGFSVDARSKADLPAPAIVEFRQRQRERKKEGYYLQVPKDSPLREQWVNLLRYKTTPVPSLERTARGRWTFAPLVFKVFEECRWFTFLDGVEVPTAHAAGAKIFSYLGFLGIPEAAGGIGMPHASLQTLAWLAVPDYIEQYLNWMRVRAGNKLTSGTIQFLATLVSLVRPNVGFLAQQPEYLQTLPTKYHALDWTALCLKQFNYLSKLEAAYTPDVCVSRDSFAPIKHILDLPQPMEAISDMVQRMRHDRPTTCESAEAIWARDIFLVKLMVSNPLRLRNIACLEWSPENVDGRHPDDKCALYQRVDKSWWISIPKRFLKNRGGSAVYDYDSPINASVWPELERYLFKHRQILLQCPTQLVFLSRGRDINRKGLVKDGQPYKLSPPKVHVACKDLSKRLIVLTQKYLWRCDGIGTHAFRHIVATSILKAAGGDIKTAALVLHDSEPTVSKHYSGMRSGDGAARMGVLLKTTFDRM